MIINMICQVRTMISMKSFIIVIQEDIMINIIFMIKSILLYMTSIKSLVLILLV
jgi:hypothetical protein